MGEEMNYEAFVKEMALSRINRTFLNNNKKHALYVLVELFNHAEKELRIFAGCLCNDVGNNSKYIMALSDFILRGGTLRILLNAYNEEETKQSDLYKRLAYFQSINKPITIKMTTAKPYKESDPDKKEVHFTIADKIAYRIENDIENFCAEWNFNDEKRAQSIADLFDQLFDEENTKEINILKLFGYDEHK